METGPHEEGQMRFETKKGPEKAAEKGGLFEQSFEDVSKVEAVFGDQTNEVAEVFGLAERLQQIPGLAPSVESSASLALKIVKSTVEITTNRWLERQASGDPLSDDVRQRTVDSAMEEVRAQKAHLNTLLEAAEGQQA